MKKIYWLLFLMIVCGTAAGCSKEASLSDDLRVKIEETWLREKGCKLVWDEDTSDLNDTVRCYGTYEEAVVLFEAGVLTAITEITVAGETLKWPCSFTVDVYKDGNLYSLTEAYDLGFLTQEDVESIAQLHGKIVAERYEWMK